MEMFGLRYLNGVVTLELDSVKCTGCKMCVIVCPHAVFVVEKRKAMIVDKDACIECGACAVNCPEDALSVNAGVGCAAGVIQGVFKGAEPTCDCGEKSDFCC
jgi:NAD-dependent dihydropyrimidine dehydrogenase PreA subunit